MVPREMKELSKNTGNKPWKIDGWNTKMEVWKMMFLYNWGCLGSVLIFRGVLLMTEIRRSPVEAGSLYHYLQGFVHPRGAGCLSSIVFPSLPHSVSNIPDT